MTELSRLPAAAMKFVEIELYRWLSRRGSRSITNHADVDACCSGRRTSAHWTDSFASISIVFKRERDTSSCATILIKNSTRRAGGGNARLVGIGGRPNGVEVHPRDAVRCAAAERRTACRD